MAECESSKVVVSTSGQELRRSSSNRLSIGHLFLWMTTTACTLAVIAPEFILEENLASKVFVTAIAPILGASNAAVLLPVWRMVRGGPPFPTQPGHWLLVAVGIVDGTELARMAIGRMLSSPSSFEVFSEIALFVAATASAVMLVVAAMNEQMPQLWRLALRVVAVSVGLIFVSGCVMPIHGPASWAAPLAIAIYLSGPSAVLTAVAADVVKGRRFDVFHWTGIVTILLLVGLPWVMFLFG